MNRVVSPEWLDVLPPSDCRAIQSRRDLRKVNFWMGNRRIIQENLLRIFPTQPPRRLAELGAGDGTFLLRLAQSLRSRWPEVEVVLIDKQPAVSHSVRRKIEQCGWRPDIATADVFDWLQAGPPFDCIFANLFLHHFQPDALARLFALVSNRTAAFVACEPRRSPAAMLTGRLLWLLGCNSVTRHDATISIRAGFRDAEISSLWPQSGWQLREGRAGPFSHFLVAQKLNK